MVAPSAPAPRLGDAAGPGREQLLELYYWMRLTRSLEERLVNLYRQTKVVGGLFRSLEMALSWADAAARQDAAEMSAIVQRFLAEAGITPEQIEEMMRRMQEGLNDGGPETGPTNPN